MSSNKNVSINMNANYSVFSHLRMDSESENSDNEDVNLNNTDNNNKKEVVKEEIKEEKPKYVIKKKVHKSSEDDGEGWTSVSAVKSKKSTVYRGNMTTMKTTSNKKKETIEENDFMTNNQEEEDKKIETIIDTDNLEKEMKEFKFQNKWYVWMHEIDSKDWSAKSYKIIHTIESLYDFWKFFNHTQTLNQWKFNFFIMKSSSHPTWEHSTNRNGGTCSIRIDIGQSIEIIEQLSILLVNESLTDEINDINGISFAAKGNWCVIKIWNRDYKNNISNQIPSYLRKIYPAISIKYKENIPEY
jgi:hypothetical protein